MVDPERAPLVQLGFELFALGNFTLDQLSQRLYQRGLRTRPTARYPAQRVSISKLARMLRDRYYLGYVTYRSEKVPGRHEPLVDQFLFDRVQAVLDARTTSGERRRTHHHYLKGTLYCARCRQAGTSGRMIIQHTVTRRGDEYTYFFCRNRQQADCPAPYFNVAIAEHAVERYYTTVSQQQVADAVARLATGNNADDELGQALTPVQIYRICDDEQRRQLNHVIFHRLYLADGRITNHELRSDAP